MIFILEIAFLFGGGYALITGKIPTFLYGGPRYEVTAMSARRLGAVMFIMIFPLLVAFPPIFEIAFTLLVAVFVVIVMQRVRKTRIMLESDGNEVAVVSETEALIARKVNGAFVLLVFGLLLGGSLFGLLAWWRGSQGLSLINENQSGEQYRGRARFVQTLSLLLISFSLLRLGVMPPIYCYEAVSVLIRSEAVWSHSSSLI